MTVQRFWKFLSFLQADSEECIKNKIIFGFNEIRNQVILIDEPVITVNMGTFIPCYLNPLCPV
jgi:hypothetical protein